MQKGHHLSFPCTKCGKPVGFGLQEADSNVKLECKECGEKYLFEEGSLLKEIRSFLRLVEAIKGAESILSNTSVGVRVGDKEVQIPYKLLLTRLTSQLELELKGKKITLTFRSEPLRDA
jgi:DNA-directed RNA polymerase subunit RPC12/RpoP